MVKAIRAVEKNSRVQLNRESNGCNFIQHIHDVVVSFEPSSDSEREAIQYASTATGTLTEQLRLILQELPNGITVQMHRDGSFEVHVRAEWRREMALDGEDMLLLTSVVTYVQDLVGKLLPQISNLYADHHQTPAGAKQS